MSTLDEIEKYLRRAEAEEVTDNFSDGRNWLASELLNTYFNKVRNPNQLELPLPPNCS